MDTRLVVPVVWQKGDGDGVPHGSEVGTLPVRLRVRQLNSSEFCLWRRCYSAMCFEFAPSWCCVVSPAVDRVTLICTLFETVR